MGFKQTISLLIAITILVFSFQNCSKVAPVFSRSEMSKTPETDSGQSYDGKTYAVLGSRCADSSDVQARVIVYKSGRAEKNRQNCQEIVPLQLTPADYQIDSNDPNKLILSGETYVYIPPSSRTYVTFGNRCSDYLEVQSRIVVYESGLAQRNRLNCEEISPALMASTDYRIDLNDPNKLILGSEVFEYIPPSSQWLTNYTATAGATDLFFSFSYVAEPKFIYVFFDTDSTYDTGYNLGTFGIDYMIENGSVFKYAGTGGSDWTWTRIGSSNMNKASPNISWSIPRSIIGSPSPIRTMGHISNLGVYSKDVTLQ